MRRNPSRLAKRSSCRRYCSPESCFFRAIMGWLWEMIKAFPFSGRALNVLFTSARSRAPALLSGVLNSRGVLVIDCSFFCRTCPWPMPRCFFRLAFWIVPARESRTGCIPVRRKAVSLLRCSREEITRSKLLNVLWRERHSCSLLLVILLF